MIDRGWFLAALIVIAAGASLAGDADLDALVGGGRFHDAYVASRARPGAPPQTAYVSLAEKILRRGLASQDSYDRWFSLRSLSRVRWPPLIPEVRHLTTTSDLYEQSLALEFLAGMGDDPKIFVEALESPHRLVRVRALKRLESAHGLEVSSALRKVLEADPDPDLRAQAARAVSSDGSAVTIAALRKALREDGSQIVREESVSALVRLGDPETGRILRERVRHCSAEERLDVMRLVRLVPDPGLIDEIAPWLGDGDPEVRDFAAGAILAVWTRSRGGGGSGEP